MKKYLIAGAMALVFNAFVTSCSEDMSSYNSLEEEKKAQFAQNFEKFYGKPAATQDWGFGNAKVSAARTMTRGQGDNSCGECIKPDMPNFPHYADQYPNYTTPAPITEDERAYVKKWFEEHPGFTEGLNISNFYIQHVWGQANKDYNVYWNFYSNNTYTRKDFVTQATMDYVCVGDGTNYSHALDFNANDDGTNWKMVYMQNSSALSFKYHSSWSNEEFKFFKCAEIDVPGIGKGWYVGLCCYGTKYDNGDQILNKDPKDYEYCDDWILKVVPGEGSTISAQKTTKIYKKKTVILHNWVFCEDLGSSASNKDYDYNDLVFDAKIIEEHKVLRDADGNETVYTEDPSSTYYADVTPLAAGGELTIKFQDCSDNIHDMFNPAAASNVLVNTCRSDQNISLSHVEGRTASTYQYALGSTDDPNINDIIVLVRSSQAAYELTAYQGEAPHKICVPVATRWAYERTDIKEAYTGFEAYVGGGTEPWSTTGVEENLYPLDGVPYEMKTDMTGSISYEEIDKSSTTEYSYTLADAANEHVWWDDITGNKLFYTDSEGHWVGNVSISSETLKASEIGNGTIIRFYFTSESGYMIKVADNAYNDFDLGNSGWDKNFIQGNAKNGYVEFKLNTTTANYIKENGLLIYGTGLTALALTYDNSNKVADEEPETPSPTSGKTTLVSGPLNGQVHIPASSFDNIKANDEIRIYYSSWGPWWWQVQTWDGGNSQNYSIPGWGGTSINTNNNFMVETETEKYIYMTLDNNLISILQNNGIRIQADNIVVTEIALIRK